MYRKVLLLPCRELIVIGHVYLTVIITLLNCYSLKLASKVTTVFSVTKLLAVCFIVAVGVIFMVKRQTFPVTFTHPFDVLPGQEPTVSSVGLSLYNVLWAYSGWY